MHHYHHSHRPPTKADKVVGILCGGGIPLLSGVVLTPIGVHQLSKGNESLGWSFTLIGVLMVIIGAVVIGVLWPESKAAGADGE